MGKEKKEWIKELGMDILAGVILGVILSIFLYFFFVRMSQIGG
jgi:high-affinity Fe2+/Pb2+ permease